MLGQNIKLYSWVDIQDQLVAAQENGNWLSGVKVEILRSGLYLYHLPSETEEDIRAWLKSLFPNAMNDKGISLETLGNGQRILPLYFEVTNEEEIQTSSFIPSFHRPKALSTKLGGVEQRPDNSKPAIIAAHSFKGGVGRTLHSLALSLAIEEQQGGSSILLIDADFEAPGITWMVPNPEIAFVDVLNLILTTSESEQDKLISKVANDLQNQRQGKIFFLPAFRTDQQLRSLEVKPEHIFRFADNPFIITDMVAKLARKLEATHVIIDLRAGISELSASWLLDPRVAKVFVTTLNSQSVEGTLIVLELLTKKQKEQSLQPMDSPAMIISQVNPDELQRLERIWNKAEDSGSGTAGQNMGRLREAFVEYLNLNGFEEEDAQMLISPLFDSLLVFPNDWDNAKELIRKSGLLDSIKRIAKLYQTHVDIPSIAGKEIEEARSKMRQVVPDLVYAEKHLSPGFYKSQSIRNLANRHRTRLPNLVVVGAKGSGKTFLFRQIFRNQQWVSFIKEALSQDKLTEGINGQIFQVTIPEAIDQKTEVWVRHVKPHILDAASKTTSLNDWKNIWLDVMAWSFGFEVGEKNVGDAFVSHLEQHKKQVIFLFDGLEDLFPDYFQDEAKQNAMRALLQDVQAYISVTPNSPIGVITFIRRDMVEHVIKQNLGQFLDRYKEFELKWNRTEALRLVNWVMSFYNILSVNSIQQEEIPNASEDALTQSLFPLWGRRLGPDQSREAFSAKSILRKLSNFNEEVQSRDLIRFLSEAITQELNGGSTTTYADRILSPKSIRDALPEVGKEKVREVREENKNNEFAAVLVKLEDLAKSTEIKVPFESVNRLSSADISLLIDQGVLRRYEDKYYMAELFRLGLGIDKRKGKVKTDF